MHKEFLEEHFKPGDIVVFRNIDNPPFHESLATKFLHFLQSVTEIGDPSAIHVGLIVGYNSNPAAPGDTEMLIIDSMPFPMNEKDTKGVAIRPLVRNYTIEVYRLNPSIKIESATSQQIAEKALEIANEFIGMGYSIAHCRETHTYRDNRSNTELTEFYSGWLQVQHLFDPTKKTIFPNRIDDGVNCSEFVITCYQLAALMLNSNVHAYQELQPEWIRLHAHSSPAKLHDFLKHSKFFDKIGDEPTRILRFSGQPHPEDQSMAIIPYVLPGQVPPTPEPLTWAQWFYSYLPALPTLPLPALPSLSLLNMLWNSVTTPAPVALEMQITATKAPLKFDDYQMVDLQTQVKDQVISEESSQNSHKNERTY